MHLNNQIIKILGNPFQNMNCLSWIKVMSVLIDFKYCYYNIPSPQFPCLPCHPCQISPWPSENPLQRNPHHVLHRFPYFVLPHSTTRHNHQMYENICQAKPVKFNINLYLNLLLTGDSKSRSSFNIRQALSSIQSVLNSLQIDRCYLIFTTLLLHVTILTIFTKFSSADFMRHSLLLYRSIFSPPYF